MKKFRWCTHAALKCQSDLSCRFSLLYRILRLSRSVCANITCQGSNSGETSELLLLGKGESKNQIFTYEISKLTFLSSKFPFDMTETLLMLK